MAAAGCHLVFPYASSTGADAGADATAPDATLDATRDLLPAEAALDAPAIDAAPGPVRYAVSWVKHLSSAEPDEATAAVVDGAGNVYATGFLMAGINFGGGSRGTDGLPDGWLVKYSPTGGHLWSVVLPGASYDYPKGLAFGGDRLVLGGKFFEDIDFGGGVLGTTAGSADVGLALFDSGGALNDAWLHGGDEADGSSAVAVDAAGNIYLLGSGRGTWSFGGDPMVFGATDGVWIASFTPAGQHRWSHGYPGKTLSFGLAVHGDSACAAARFYESVDVGAGQALSSAGGTDALVFCVEIAAGATRWARRFGGVGNDDARGISFDAGGRLYVAGQITGDVEIAAGETINTEGGTSACSVRFDPADGTPVWARAFPATGGSFAAASASPRPGVMCVAGAFASELAFGDTQHVSNGDDDIFVGCLDADGGAGWSTAIGGDALDRAEGLASGPSGELYLVGYQEGSGDYGAGLHSAPGGWSDGLLLKLVPEP